MRRASNGSAPGGVRSYHAKTRRVNTGRGVVRAHRGSVRAVNWRPASTLPALGVLLSLSGCGGSTSPPPDGSTLADASGDRPTATSLSLGTGQSAWEELPADRATNVELIHGPQGGYHVFGRVRFSGIEPPVTLSFRVVALDDGSVLNDPEDRYRLRPGLGLSPSGDGWESSSAQLVILTAISHPAQVVGRRCRIEARVEPLNDPAGVTVSREVIVVDET